MSGLFSIFQAGSPSAMQKRALILVGAIVLVMFVVSPRSASVRSRGHFVANHNRKFKRDTGRGANAASMATGAADGETYIGDFYLSTNSRPQQGSGNNNKGGARGQAKGGVQRQPGAKIYRERGPDRKGSELATTTEETTETFKDTEHGVLKVVKTTTETYFQNGDEEAKTAVQGAGSMQKQNLQTAAGGMQNMQKKAASSRKDGDNVVDALAKKEARMQGREAKTVPTESFRSTESTASVGADEGAPSPSFLAFSAISSFSVLGIAAARQIRRRGLLRECIENELYDDVDFSLPGSSYGSISKEERFNV